MAFNAGYLSVYCCVKGSLTAQESIYTNLKAKPPYVVVEVLELGDNVAEPRGFPGMRHWNHGKTGQA